MGVVFGGTPRRTVDEHLDELERLVDTAGGIVVAREIQERPAPDPATVVGSGFIGRLADRCRDESIDTVVFDEDLTGSQVRNIERSLPTDVKVLDRAAVILDIFAQRARSREAQTQVELAQLSYLLPRLTRRWRHLSRQAGGIGTGGRRDPARDRPPPDFPPDRPAQAEAGGDRARSPTAAARAVRSCRPSRWSAIPTPASRRCSGA